MKTAEHVKIPELRFPEFSGEWVEKRLGDISTWRSGGTPSKDQSEFWDGDISWISASSMHGYKIDDSKFKISELGLRNGSRLTGQGTLLLLVRGSMLYKRIPLGIAQCAVAFNQDVKAIDAGRETNVFLLPWLQAKEHLLLSMVTGTGIGAGKLETSDLKGLKVGLPDLPEQKKISSFLSAVDRRIEGLEKKRDLLKEYKKGLMQQLFNQSLRFGNGNEPFPEWEEKRLGEVASKVRAKNAGSTERAVLTNSATQGVIDQSDYFDKDIANQENLEGYYIVDVDDFVYNPRISVTAPVGPLNRNKLRRGVMSPLYTVIRFKSGDLSFYQSYFVTTYWHKYMCAVANYGARHDRMNVTGSDFFDMPIPYPCPEEQRKIADCLSAVDRKIGQVETQVARTREFKQGLLQKMFV